jgi:hypothetical protein
VISVPGSRPGADATLAESLAESFVKAPYQMAEEVTAGVTARFTGTLSKREKVQAVRVWQMEDPAKLGSIP